MGQYLHILLIEDNEGDILLTKEALKETNGVATISVARDGEEGITFLKQNLAISIASLPNLILLDINLPKKNGHEVLKYIKSTDGLKHIPVIMLTTSSYSKDINESYENFANCYVTKSVVIEDFLDAIYKLIDFWANVVNLPSYDKQF
jgi:CheY-like chemotaxis protein